MLRIRTPARKGPAANAIALAGNELVCTAAPRTPQPDRSLNVKRQQALGRNVDAAQARKWIDGGPYTAEKAEKAGLIDEVEHRQDFEAMLKSKYGQDVVFDKKYGQKQQPTLDLSSPFGMFKLWGELLGQGQKKAPTKNSVGIVHVEGPIVLGGGQASLFGDASAQATKIRKALDDDPKQPRYIETVPTVGYRFIGNLADDRVGERVEEERDGDGGKRRTVHHARFSLLEIIGSILRAEHGFPNV